ncbi:hypothetical protein C4J81_16590 [Deltaproteobacteria bacterium Smac51]|nr:hypothetical protein C4J81_16590 [Deltaproteobacteria bacterium Smac51]
MLIYRNDYNKNEYTPEQTAILKEFVATAEYKQMLAEETTYWVIVKLEEKVGEPLDKQWFRLLQATWQAEGTDRYETYARETIRAIEALLANPEGKKEKDIETVQILLGELNRRIGEFDKAKAVFENLLTKPEFKEHDFYPGIIKYELKLIAAGNKFSHSMSDINGGKKTKW